MKYIYRTLWVLFLPIYVILVCVGLGIWFFLLIPYQAIYFIRKGEINKDIDPDKTYMEYANKVYEKLLPK